MGVVTVEPAGALPVTIEEARTFCRYPFTDEDTLISELIAAAVEHVEQATNRAFVKRTFAATFRGFPPGDIIRLRPSPLISVTSVTVKGRDGTAATLAEDDDYLVDTTASPGTIEPVRSWPITGDFPDAVRVVFVAGYPSDGGSPENLTVNVPARAKAAVKALTAWWFEQREPGVLAPVNEAPYHVKRLINGLRDWR
jgi:uncharacterized phiE125 gp8 family phage protein